MTPRTASRMNSARVAERTPGIAVACVYLGLSLGLFVGGMLTAGLGWRAIFLFMAPSSPPGSSSWPCTSTTSGRRRRGSGSTSSVPSCTQGRWSSHS